MKTDKILFTTTVPITRVIGNYTEEWTIDKIKEIFDDDEDCLVYNLVEYVEKQNKALAGLFNLFKDYLDFDEEDRPVHDCGYITNPPAGHCHFCDVYTEVESLL